MEEKRKKERERKRAMTDVKRQDCLQLTVYYSSWVLQSWWCLFSSRSDANRTRRKVDGRGWNLRIHDSSQLLIRFDSQTEKNMTRKFSESSVLFSFYPHWICLGYKFALDTHYLSVIAQMIWESPVETAHKRNDTSSKRRDTISKHTFDRRSFWTIVNPFQFVWHLSMSQYIRDKRLHNKSWMLQLLWARTFTSFWRTIDPKGMLQVLLWVYSKCLSSFSFFSSILFLPTNSFGTQALDEICTWRIHQREE